MFYLFSTEICGSCYINSPLLSAVSKDSQAQRLTRINSFPRSCSQKEQLKNDFPPKPSVRLSCHVGTSSTDDKKSQQHGQVSPGPPAVPKARGGPMGDAEQRRGS